MHKCSHRIKDFGIARKFWVLAAHKPGIENKKVKKQLRVLEDGKNSNFIQNYFGVFAKDLMKQI